MRLARTYSGFRDLDDGFDESDLALGQVHGLPVGDGEKPVLHDGPRVAGILGGSKVCFVRDCSPVGFLLDGQCNSIFFER